MHKLIILFFLTVSFFVAQGQETLDMKIGQMILIGVDNDGAEPNKNLLTQIEAGKAGGIIIFEKNIPTTDSYFNLKRLIWRFQEAAPSPLFVAIDQEGGRVNRLKTKYGFPRSVSASYLGKLQNPDSTFFYAEVTAATLAGLGINVNFAPVVDVAVNPDNPVIARVERSYSANPDSVAIHAKEVIKAHRQFGVLTALKHFPGHGSSHADTHLGIADVTDYWKEYELDPYKSLIEDNYVDGIMSAHIVNKKLDRQGRPGTLSSEVLDKLLRKRFGYEGIIFSDDMQMHAVTKHYGLESAIELAIKAGIDVMIFSNNISGSENQTVTRVHNIIKRLVSEGKIDEDRINESYERIMKAKEQFIKK